MKIIRIIAHKAYVILGTVLCNLCSIWWQIRDKISPPNTDAVLFVAHPDDDTLFFHTYIKDKKPYVCLMTTGWSLRRMPCFFKAMKYYGVRFRAYPLGTNDTRIGLHEKIIKDVLGVGKFRIVATHNATGEYGHEEHMRVHSAVASVLKKNGSDATLLCPAAKECIVDYPLPRNIIAEKQEIFKTIYTTESWVLDEDTVWVENEFLVEQ